MCTHLQETGHWDTGMSVARDECLFGCCHVCQEQLCWIDVAIWHLFFPHIIHRCTWLTYIALPKIAFFSNCHLMKITSEVRIQKAEIALQWLFRQKGGIGELNFLAIAGIQERLNQIMWRLGSTCLSHHTCITRLKVKAMFQTYNWFGTEFHIFGEFKINTDDRQHIKAPHIQSASVHAQSHHATSSLWSLRTDGCR